MSLTPTGGKWSCCKSRSVREGRTVFHKPIFENLSPKFFLAACTNIQMLLMSLEIAKNPKRRLLNPQHRLLIRRVLKLKSHIAKQFQQVVPLNGENTIAV